MTLALSTVLANRQLDGDLVRFDVTEDWAQGRTLFGGFLSALAVVAMRDSLSLDLPLRALQVNFVGPVAPGSVQFRTRLLRQGKNVAQVQTEIWAADELAGLVVGVFGVARASQLPVKTLERPVFPKTADECFQLPFIPKITPNFIQHIDMRWAVGSVPYAGADFWESGIYLRSKEASISQELQIVMLSDGPPTPSLCQFKGPVMGSSVSWSLELPTLKPTEWDAEDWFQIAMDTQAASEGYVNQTAKLWAPDGQLASLGYQVVAVYG